MQRLKLFSTAMMAILALTAVMATTASAKPEFLDTVKGNIFEGKGLAGELTTLKSVLTIKCKENSVTGEVTGNEEGIIKTLDFKGCTAFGLTASSLGDAAGTILTAEKIPFKLCYTNQTTKEVGIIIEKIPTVHIDVLGGSLANVEGSIIGKLSPANVLLDKKAATLAFSGEKGDQTPTTCTLLGKELKASLLSSEDTKHEVRESAAIKQTNDEITFASDIEVDA